MTEKKSKIILFGISFLIVGLVIGSLFNFFVTGQSKRVMQDQINISESASNIHGLYYTFDCSCNPPSCSYTNNNPGSGISVGAIINHCSSCCTSDFTVDRIWVK